MKSKWLILILGIGVLIRSYQLTPVFLERGANRQIIDAQMVRHFYTQGWFDFDFHLYGFPLYHWMVAGCYEVLGGVQEVCGRWLSVGFSVITAYLFYALLLLWVPRRQAFLGLVFFYLLSPVHIIMSRSFLIDEMTLMLMIMGIYFLAKKRFWWGSISLSLMVLSKFTFGYVLLPAMLLVKKKSWLLVITLLPSIAWYLFTKQFNEQLHGQATGEWSPFYVFSWQRLISLQYYINSFYHFARYAITPAWIGLFWLGLVKGGKNIYRKVFYGWFIGAIGFLVYFNIPSLTHNYYFLALVPAAAFFASEAAERLAGKVTLWSSIVLLVIGLGTVVSEDFIKSYRPYPPALRMPMVAKVVKSLTKPKEKIVYSAYASAALPYFANRNGWELRLVDINDAAIVKHLESYKALGAKYYVLYDQKELAGNEITASYLKQLPVVFRDDAGSVIFSL